VTTSRAEISSRWLVAADGLSSPTRRAVGLESPVSPRRGRRYGYRRHFRVRPWSRFVEVHWATGCEAYVTPVAQDEVSVALLWHEPAPSFESMLSRFPDLAARLRGATVTTTLVGAGPFRRRARRVTTGRVALVGDAAGYLDAITGDGIALGFRGARAVARALSLGCGLADYEAAHRSMTRRYRVMSELLLLLTVHPRLRQRVLGLLARVPSLFELGLSIHQRAVDVE
jgi:flavin-dependent dehydrogenase